MLRSGDSRACRYVLGAKDLEIRKFGPKGIIDKPAHRRWSGYSWPRSLGMPTRRQHPPISAPLRHAGAASIELADSSAGQLERGARAGLGIFGLRLAADLLRAVPATLLRGGTWRRSGTRSSLWARCWQVRRIKIIFPGNTHQGEQRVAARIGQRCAHPLRRRGLADRAHRPFR